MDAKQAIRIGPGRERLKSRTSRQRLKPLERVFIRVFSVNRLPFQKTEALPFNSGDLRLLTDQMHLDTGILFVEERLVGKIRGIYFSSSHAQPFLRERAHPCCFMSILVLLPRLHCIGRKNHC